MEKISDEKLQTLRKDIESGLVMIVTCEDYTAMEMKVKTQEDLLEALSQIQIMNAGRDSDIEWICNYVFKNIDRMIFDADQPIITDNPELQRLAKKAANGGSLEDLHEYLKLRRNFI